MHIFERSYGLMRTTRARCDFAHERTDTSGRCLNKPLCSYMAYNWLTHGRLVRMPQLVVAIHTAAGVYAATAETCIVLACAALRSLRRHLTNGCHEIL